MQSLMGRFSYDTVLEIPGYGESTRRLRSVQSIAASRTLLFASCICVVRAAIVPWYMHFNPGQYAFTDLEIVTTSVVLACVFAIASLWAKFSPMGAIVVALLFFAGVCYRDFTVCPKLLEQGLISKTLLTVLLVRGFMSALMSRIM